jgi:hypothetical protein
MAQRLRYTRREVLRTAAFGLLSAPFAALARTAQQKEYWEPARVPFRGSDDALLDNIERAAFDFIWNEAGTTTGQVKDRALLNGNDTLVISSIAATGFGSSGHCIAEARGYRKKEEIVKRVRDTLRFLWQKLPHVHGFYYHFVDMNTGARKWECEISSIDTSILLCGVLTARQHFADAEIQDLATKIYARVDWPWMLNDDRTLSMGWHPEDGFLKYRWDHYCELMMIYLLAMAAPVHPIPSETWNAWTRPTVSFDGLEYISGPDPLFTHQYSQAWEISATSATLTLTILRTQPRRRRRTNYSAFPCAINFPITASICGVLPRRTRLRVIRLGVGHRRRESWMAASFPALLVVPCRFFIVTACWFCAQ